MTNKLEKSLTQFRDLLDGEIADYFLIDTCLTGHCFVNGGSNWVLRRRIAKRNNLPSEKIREYIRSSEAFIEILDKYPKIFAANAVLGELECRREAMSEFSRCYGARRNSHKSEWVSRIPKSIDKEKNLIEKLIFKESKILESLRLRTDSPNDDLISLEEAVKYSNRFARDCNKNQNDELIVAAALYRAIAADKHVAIMTRDTRFSYIVANLQKFFASNPIYDGLSDFLAHPRLSVFLRTKEEGFTLDYCSQDFSAN